ncbi:MAG: DNA polymerase III subunit beta [Candidatus Ancillula sp.]|jgi:DNA polymerase-3 subunit beta|nr:DNA polymerase III subunit beta [Candidatus Ancillula sp.]
MKLQIEKETLINSLDWSTKFLTSRPSIPIFAAIKLTANKEGFSTEITNLEVTSKTKELIPVENDGEVLVHAKFFTDIVRSMPAGKILINDNEKTGKLEVSSGKNKTNIPIYKSNEFPETEEAKNLIGSINSRDFSNALVRVGIASAREDTTPILQTIKIDLQKDKVILSAIDRYRIARKEIPWKSNKDIDKSIIIKNKTLIELAKSIENSTTTDIYFDEENSNIITFSTGSYNVTTQIVAGTFPPTEKLFEQKYNQTIYINKSDINSALSRISIISNNTTSVTTIFNDKTITLITDEINEYSAQEVVDCSYSGEEIKIKFNIQFLKEGIAQISENYICFDFEETTKPIRLTGADKPEEESKDNYKYIIVPIKIG